MSSSPSDRRAAERANRALATIARFTEGVKRLSPGFRAAHADVDWRAVAGFRDVLVHQFDAVLPDLV